MNSNVNELNDQWNGHHDHENQLSLQQQQQEQQHLLLQQIMANQIVHLQQNCQDLLKQVQMLTDEKHHWFKQCCIFRYLYTQEKHDRNRLSKMLTTLKRELEFHYQNSNCSIDPIPMMNNGTLRNTQSYTYNSISRRKRKRINTRSSKSRYSEQKENNNCLNKINNGENNSNNDSNTTTLSSSADPDLDLNLYDWNQYSFGTDVNNNNSLLVNDETNISKSLRQSVNFSKFLLSVNDYPIENIQNDEQKVQIPKVSKINEENDLVVEDPRLFVYRELKLCNKPKRFLGLFFDVSQPDSVVIKQVVQNSRADQAGLKSGDRLLEICGINMRQTNCKIAEKIIRECEENEIDLKVVSYPQDNNNKENSQHECSNVRKSSLVRRKAFSMKTKSHPYFQRKQLELYGLGKTSYNVNLNQSLPRRIQLPYSLENLKLCGGNAVGIFVHDAIEELSRFLRTGDQLLRYRDIDLTNTTAEDAAICLARRPPNPVIDLVVVFNIDAYNQIQNNPMGDSFYIRAEFNGFKWPKALQFKKGDILYVDNTLYTGQPGQYWRAWRIDDFGNAIESGSIPSKYNSDTNIIKQIKYGEYSNGNGTIIQSFKKFFNRFSLFSSENTNNNVDGIMEIDKNNNEKRTKVLAAFIDEDEEEKTSNCNDDHPHTYPNESLCSYRIVEMVKPNRLRPVILIGPYNHMVAEKLEKSSPLLFKLFNIINQKFFPNHSNSDDYQKYIDSQLKNLIQISDNGFHSIISISDANINDTLNNSNNLNDYLHQNGLYPVLFLIQFRSAKHIRDTINKQWIKGATGLYQSKDQIPITMKMARALYECQLKIIDKRSTTSTSSSLPMIILNANNMNFLCTMIKQHVLEEQNKVIWK